jgi:chaperonin GroEL
MTHREPSVVSAPHSIQQLKRGFDQLAELLAVTLGPSQGIVLSASDLKPRPELLTDAAVIARRVTELPDPEQNMGAMLLRNMAWRMRERTGDGSALTVVLSQAILERAMRSVAAGANPMSVTRGIRMAVAAAVTKLKEMAGPVHSEADLTAVARAATGQEELSWVLGEMFDLLGPSAYITIEDYMAPYLERVYLDGGRWLGDLISPYLITAPGLGRGVQTHCRVALFDGNLTAAEEIRPLLECMGRLIKPASKGPGAGDAHADPIPSLLLVAHKISDEALNLLAATHQRTPLKVIAFALKRAGLKAAADLQDLALLTGAALLSPAFGRRMQSVTEADLGACQRAEAGAESLFVVGGAGDPAKVRTQIELLQAHRKAAPIGDENITELEMRLGRMSGSAGILKVGAISDAERDFLHQRAEQGIQVLRGALQEGVLPGGGTAYLHSLPAVKALVDEALSDDEIAGVRAVMHGLEAPFRRLLANAGIPQPAVHQAEILRQAPGLFYNVQTRSLEQAHQSGVLDSAMVIRAALETAASGAMMALTTDTLVVKRKPRISYEP